MVCVVIYHDVNCTSWASDARRQARVRLLVYTTIPAHICRCSLNIGKWLPHNGTLSDAENNIVRLQRQNRICTCSRQCISSSFASLHHSYPPLGDRLYLGTSIGNLHIYGLDVESDQGEEPELVEVKKGLGKRAIEQLGFIKDINSLVLLSGVC